MNLIWAKVSPLHFGYVTSFVQTISQTLGGVIKAFDLGVATMKLGEKCNLICAPEYAYGATGSPPSIPPNATLIFEVSNC